MDTKTDGAPGALTGCVVMDDGRRWLRITDSATGEVWDEPMTGWKYVLTLMAKAPNGLSGPYFAHPYTGRIVWEE